RARHEHVWVKVSAPYRSADAERMLNRILGDTGRDRLLWGSDWPWTRHEQGRTYAGCLDWLRDRVDKETFDAATAYNPAKLLNWSPALSGSVGTSSNSGGSKSDENRGNR